MTRVGARRNTPAAETAEPLTPEFPSFHARAGAVDTAGRPPNAGPRCGRPHVGRSHIGRPTSGGRYRKFRS